MAFKLTVLALVAVGVAVTSAADSKASAQVSSSTPTWTQLQQSKHLHLCLVFGDLACDTCLASAAPHRPQEHVEGLNAVLQLGWD